MAPSLFNRPYQSFLLLGLTGDHFCLPDTRLVDLPTYLDLHLRGLGFQQIAFHHPLKGVRVTIATDTSQPVAEPLHRPTSTHCPTLTSLVPGPLGNMKMLPDRPPTTPPASSDTRPQAHSDYRRVEDLELPSYIAGFFHGDQHKALIFQDLGYLFDVPPNARRTLWAVINTVPRPNIVVFVFNNAVHIEIQSLPQALRGHFIAAHDSVRDNVIRVGAPHADEILNLQRRLRIRENVPTNFKSQVRACEIKSANLREKPDLEYAMLTHNQNPLTEDEWTMAATPQSALDRLSALPGRTEVAERIKLDIEYATKQQTEHTDNGPDSSSSGAQVHRLLDISEHPSSTKVNLSYAMAGNTGTGKTIIARMIAEAMKEGGILRSGHFIEATVQDLVAGYVGQSALKTSELLDRARGGALFVDEVQSFEPENPFHREAIGTILKYVEDHRGDISVIVATYPNNMDAFLAIDDGLASRFSQRIDLPDYDATTCVEIFKHIANDQYLLKIDTELRDRLRGLFDEWINDHAPAAPFANGRSVRNLVEAMDRIRSEQGGREAPLSGEHVPEDYQTYFEEAGAAVTLPPVQLLTRARADLEALPGLAAVKHAINQIVNGIIAAQMRGEDAGALEPGHYSFEGAPGTGKTTVARLLGTILHRLRVLKSSSVVEVKRDGLVAEFTGQTAPKVQKTAETALDGVLFIDEAHNLIQGEQDIFGKEAIGALTSILEDERRRLCVIVAGYSDEMTRLFKSDRGWESRFTRIQFEDYKPEEMEQILRMMCEQQNWTLHPDLERRLPDVLRALRDTEGDDFANGRSIRNLLETMKGGLNARVVANETSDMYQLTIDDVPDALVSGRH